MAINNRTVTIKNVFASTAETNIPNPPVPGQSYRNTNLTSEEVGQGWPFKEIVDSAKFNEAMFEYTTICQQLEKYGFLPWSANTDYPAGGCALGTNGNVYQAKQATGPSTTSVDPVNDTNHTYWDLFYYSSFTANRAIVSNGSGKLIASAITATQLGYLSGVTSSIQTQINNKANNNAVVHLSGTETIAGAKTFTSNLIKQTANESNGLRVQNTTITKGTTPSTTLGGQFVFQDKNGFDLSHRLGGVEVEYNKNGNINTRLLACKPENGSSTYANINVTYPASGSPFTYAPAPTDTTTTSGTQIATTGWVNSAGNNVVHRTNSETIAGTKTFTSDPFIKNASPFLYLEDTAQTKGTAPSADVWGAITFNDANGNLMGRCRQLYNSSKMNTVELQVHKANSSSDTDSATMGISYPASGNPHAFAPASDVNGSIVTTVNKHKERRGSFAYGNGMIVNFYSSTSDEASGTTFTFREPFTSASSYGVACTGTNRDQYLDTSFKTATNFKILSNASGKRTYVAIGY